MAMASLREYRGSGSVEREQRRNFQSSSLGKRSKPSPWTHTFYCLANRSQVRVPTTQPEKRGLVAAGLGEKKVVVPDVNCSSKDFLEIIEDHFPKLKGARGFEFLRCTVNTRDLEIIAPPTCYNPRLLKSVAGSGRVYLRPIQCDLDLAPMQEFDQEISSVCCVLHDQLVKL